MMMMKMIRVGCYLFQNNSGDFWSGSKAEVQRLLLIGKTIMMMMMLMKRMVMIMMMISIIAIIISMIN